MKQLKILLILFACVSCDPNSRRLMLVNNTDEVIYYRLLLDSVLREELYLYEVLPNDTTYPNFVKSLKPTAWDYKINKYSIDSSLYIFIFHSNELDSRTIQNHNYQRFNFTVEELNEMQWIFDYYKP